MTIGILLAGGKSSRFKEDKALYFDPRFQKSWSELQLEKLTTLTTKVYVVANPANQASLNQKLAMYEQTILLDDPEYFGQGPLSGLYAVAKKTKETDFFILGIDYPDVRVSQLKTLLQKKNVYALDGDFHPHYTLCHLSFHYLELKEFLATGNRRLRDFLRQCEATGLLITTDTLKNYNQLN